MGSPDQQPDGGKKIHDINQELNDLRQGLTAVTDFYRDLESLAKRKEAGMALDQTIVKPLVDEDREFEAIWQFHNSLLVADPAAEISREEMFGAFTRGYGSPDQPPIEEDAFIFLLSLMENPRPVFSHGKWTGCRFRTGTD